MPQLQPTPVRNAAQNSGETQTQLLDPEGAQWSPTGPGTSNPNQSLVLARSTSVSRCNNEGVNNIFSKNFFSYVA
ncbi:hypothetical protein K1719_014760 [Acacia pycnantha]|nr:hypothetical protein K1719_014760 [Acacia pycnantha]